MASRMYVIVITVKSVNYLYFAFKSKASTTSKTSCLFMALCP